MNESALLRAAKAGDCSAFEQLAKNYEQRVLKLAYYIARNHDDAEDIVQESFLKTFKNLAQFREESQFYTWLSRIVVNQALMALRRQRLVKMVPIEIQLEQQESMHPLEIVDPRPNPEDRIRQQQLGFHIRRAVDELRAPARNVFVMRVVQGLSIAETADALKISVPLVKTRLFRARLELQRRLSVHFGNSLGRSRLGSAVALERQQPV